MDVLAVLEGSARAAAARLLTRADLARLRRHARNMQSVLEEFDLLGFIQ